MFAFGVFVASQNVGDVTLIREQLIKLSHKANIVALYIKPEKCVNTLGKALIIKAIEQVYSMEGVEQIYWLKKLYVSCGFEVFGKDKRALKFDNTYYDEAYMVLVL